jgi:hypothetical protein
MSKYIIENKEEEWAIEGNWGTSKWHEEWIRRIKKKHFSQNIERDTIKGCTIKKSF